MSTKMRAFELFANVAADLWVDHDSEDYREGLFDLVCLAAGLDVDQFRQPVADVIVSMARDGYVSEMTVARSMKMVRDALDSRRVRLVCGYPMIGDHPGEEWMNLVFPHHVEAGRIHAWSYTDSHIHVCEYVRFTVDVSVPDEIADDDPQMNLKLHTWAVGFVNELVGDSDAEVHFISAIPKEES